MQTKLMKKKTKEQKKLKKDLLRSLKVQEAIINKIREDFKYADLEAFEKL